MHHLYDSTVVFFITLMSIYLFRLIVRFIGNINSQLVYNCQAIQETSSISEACMCRMHFNSVLKWRLEMHALTHVWEFLDLWLLMSSVDFKKAKYFVYRMTSSFYRVFQVFTSIYRNVDSDEKCICLIFANVRNHVIMTFNVFRWF